MFELSHTELEKLDAQFTTQEIKQQPELWAETFDIYTDHKEEITHFLEDIAAKHDRIHVILTGAGTSAYVGDTALPYLKEQAENEQWQFESIPTTNLVSNPYQFFHKDFPTVLVSFARSGNSPESVATVDLAEQLVDELYKIDITCAPDGELAKRAEKDERTLLLLMPERANDKGFAMTGSFSTMLLMTTLVFSHETDETLKGYVDEIVKLGQDVIKREDDVVSYIKDGFSRIIYLGSGPFTGLTHEAQLKVLELTAGDKATQFESSMGFRHGPKSFLNDDTIIFLFVSNHPYTRQYDLDMLREMQADGIAKHIVALQASQEENYEGENFTLSGGSALPDIFLSFPYVLFAQALALNTSVQVNNKPDHPSPTGTVNRVVKGVIIHPFKPFE